MGIVYILANPAMPGIVKIGKTDRTVEQRLRDLDSTGVPVPFECVAAWEFENAASVERTLHQAFGATRVRESREFFRVSPDQPIAILTEFGAKDVTPQDDVVDEQNAEDDRHSLDVARLKRERFRFSMVGIKPGETLTSVWDESVTCTVVDDRRVSLDGEVATLSAAATRGRSGRA
ncbi:MAG: GIY-YIG nuclease family protein [Rhodospirillaceae bacterium]|nr:GIY-YIG nuclease family protein [Rhodospirillaceae bacterium]